MNLKKHYLLLNTSEIGMLSHAVRKTYSTYKRSPSLLHPNTPSFSEFSTLYSEHCQSPLTRLLLPDSPANPSPGWRCRYPLLHCWNTMSTDLKVFHESELHSTIKLHNKTFPAVVLKLSHLQLVIKQRVKGQELDFPPLHVLCS